MKPVTLGRTGIEVSPLCIGTGTNGWGKRSNQTDLGRDVFVNLLVYAYERGITFWDAADQYGSHAGVREALRQVGRENVVVTTKTTARTAEDASADIDRFREELGVDQLDILLLHCLFDPEWPTTYSPVMEVLSEAKAAGTIRALGVSCHNFGAFQTAAETEWVEVVLARINHQNLHMDATHQEVTDVLRTMYSRGKGVYGMKVMGCGQLGETPEENLRFVFGLGCVDAVTVGMVSRGEIDQNRMLVEKVLEEAGMRAPASSIP